MKIATTIFLLIILGVGCKSQDEIIKANVKNHTFDKTASRICDSIQTISMKNDTLEVIRKQIDIQNYFLEKAFVANAPTYKNLMNGVSVYNYKLMRNLNKGCSEYKLKGYLLPLRTNIFDIEGDFNNNELDSIKKYARELERNKKVRFLIVSLDETYPYQNINEYAEKQGNEWGIGMKSEKGGIVFVFSKTLRQMRISNSNIAQQYLTDNESQEIINNILLPNFKEEKYYNGIIEMIKEIDKKL